MTNATATLFIIAAPSGAGKTSLVDALVSSVDNITVSISHTTRPPRASEEHGRNYHFIDQETFVRLREQGDFLESAEVFGNCYGTSKQSVQTELAAGRDVILEIDWQGAAIVREKMPASVGIFILPPAKLVLEQRLRKRAQDDEAVIARRMQEAKSEMSHYHEFDYLVVNDDFEIALQQLQHIIFSQRCRVDLQTRKQAKLIDELLA